MTRGSATDANCRGGISGAGGAGGGATLIAGGQTQTDGRSEPAVASFCCGQFWRRNDGWSMTRSPVELRAAAGGGGRRRGGGRELGESGRSEDAAASNAVSSWLAAPLHPNQTSPSRHALVTSALIIAIDLITVHLRTRILQYCVLVDRIKQASELYEFVRLVKLLFA